mgnify:FL=1
MSKFTIDDLIKEAEEAYKAGNYTKANNVYQELYYIYKRELGEKHPYTLDVLDNLANSYQCLGDYNVALVMRNAIYNGRKEILGENHPYTIWYAHILI